MGLRVQEPNGSRKRVQGVQACTPLISGVHARAWVDHTNHGGVRCARHAEPQRRTAFQPDTGVSPPVRSRAHSVGSRTRTGITTRGSLFHAIPFTSVPRVRELNTCGGRWLPAGVAHSLHGDLSALKLLDCENGYAQHRELRRLALPAQLLLHLEDLHIYLHLHLVDLDTARGKPDA